MHSAGTNKTIKAFLTDRGENLYRLVTRMSAEKTWPSSCTKCWWFSRGYCQTWSAFSSEVASASSVPKSCKWKLVKRRSLIEFLIRKLEVIIPDLTMNQFRLYARNIWQRVTILNHLMQRVLHQPVRRRIQLPHFAIIVRRHRRQTAQGH